MKKRGDGQWDLPFLQKTLVSLIVFSIALIGIPLQGISQSGPSSFSGEQIYRGLYFGETPVAQMFPDIWASDEATLPLDTKEKVLEWDNLKEQITAEVGQIDSTFFTRFGVEMQSGDHIRVQDALLESSNKTAAALQNLGLMDSNGEPTNDFRGRMACSAAVACVVAVVLAAAVAVAVAVVAAVVIWVWRYASRTGLHDPTEQDSQLYREYLINQMADRLDASA